MDVLEAYDLTSSYRSAAQLCGVDHHTAARYVAARQAGLDPLSTAGPSRGSVCDPFAEKITEWVDRSQGRVRADVVHRKLEALGYHGFKPAFWAILVPGASTVSRAVRTRLAIRRSSRQITS